MANILKIFKGNNKLRADQVYYDGTTSLLEAVWPIGRGFIDFTNTDYSNYLGFKWERELVGMVGVGLDTTQTEFNTIGKTGGSKYLQEHTHTYFRQKALYSDPEAPASLATSIMASNTVLGRDMTAVVNTYGVYNITTGNSGNLQPYKVVAYWKRVS